MWGLYLLLYGGCVCYCMGVVFVIVGIVFVLGELCLLLCGVVFVIVIFVWFFKFSNVVWDKFGEFRGSSFIRCFLCQFEIGELDKGLLDLSVSHSAPHFGVSALCLKCTEHVDRHICVVQ